MTSPPSQEEWNAIKESITGLHQSYQTVLAHNVLQDLHCKKLQQALAAKEKSKGKKKNAQQLLGTNSGQILTGDVMITLRKAYVVNFTKVKTPQITPQVVVIKLRWNSCEVVVVYRLEDRLEDILKPILKPMFGWPRLCFRPPAMLQLDQVASSGTNFPLKLVIYMNRVLCQTNFIISLKNWLVFGGRLVSRQTYITMDELLIVEHLQACLGHLYIFIG